MKAIKVVAGTAALGVSLFASAAANSEILFDNLSAFSSGTLTALDYPAGPGPLFESFSTGSSAILVTSLSLFINATTPGDGGTFEFGVFGDSSTSPDLSSPFYISAPLPDSDLSTNLGAETFSLDISLSPDTRYWAGLVTMSGSVNWSYSSDLSGPGVASEYSADVLAGAINVFANEDAGAAFQMEVVGTPVPEPAAWMLTLAGFGCLGLAAALHRRVASAT